MDLFFWLDERTYIFMYSQNIQDFKMGCFHIELTPNHDFYQKWLLHQSFRNGCSGVQLCHRFCLGVFFDQQTI